MSDQPKDPGPDSPEQGIAELEEQSRLANEKLYKAKEREHEKRTLGSFKQAVDDQQETQDAYVSRIAAYGADTKARLLGYGAFNGSQGELVWIVAGSIYAIEKDPNESFTMLKTASEPFALSDSPDAVLNELMAIRFEGSQEAVRENQAEYVRRASRSAESDGAKKRPDTHASTSTGPDFQSVSDLVGSDLDDPDGDLHDLEFPEDGEDS